MLKVPLETILDQGGKAMLAAHEEAYSKGALFDFGVDNTQAGWRITLNYRAQGIYLYSDVTQFRAKYPDKNLDGVIAPDPFRAGTIEGKAYKTIDIYVTPNAFDTFCLEAQQVFNLYCRDGMCFRGIPDIWFIDFQLIQFIRNNLYPHVTMVMWFRGNISATPFWLSRPIVD